MQIYSQGNENCELILFCRANGEDFTSNTEVFTDNRVIRFTGATGAEQGAYICTATNEAGTVSMTATLVVQGNMTILNSLLLK